MLSRLFKLLQLPYHQSLTDHDMDWMIAALQKLGAGQTAPQPSLIP